MAQVDIEQDQQRAPQVQLDKLTAMAAEVLTRQANVIRLEMEVEEEQKKIDDLVQHRIPDFMTSIGMNNFSLTDGTELKVKPYVRGSIPTLSAIEKEQDPIKQGLLLKRRKDAFSWLRKVKADALIKNELVATFGTGMDKMAKKFLDLLKTKAKVPVSLEESVNFQTLNSFFRERMEQGKSIPEKPFELFMGKKAELKMPKEEAQKKLRAIQQAQRDQNQSHQKQKKEDW